MTGPAGLSLGVDDATCRQLTGRACLEQPGSQPVDASNPQLSAPGAQGAPAIAGGLATTPGTTGGLPLPDVLANPPVIPPPPVRDGSEVPAAPAETPPPAQEEIPAGYYPRADYQEDEYGTNGGEPHAPAEAEVEGGQASPPDSSKIESISDFRIFLRSLGIDDSKITDEMLEDGKLEHKELDEADPNHERYITDAAFNLVSRGGLGINVFGGVAADEDGINYADAERFMEKVIEPLVDGTKSQAEVISRFMHASRFRVIPRHALSRTFREQTHSREGLWQTENGATTLNAKTFLDKYIRPELRELAGKVLANILGHAVTDADQLNEEQLDTFMLTIYYLARIDTPREVMEGAKAISDLTDQLEGSTPETFIAWLTRGAEQEVPAEEHVQGGSGAAQTSSESRVISGNIAATTVINSALSLTTGADPNFVKAIKILNLAIDENKFMRPIEDETGIHEVEYTLEIDEEGRRELLAARETAITRMVLGEEGIVKGDLLGQLLEKRDFEGALALLRSALAGSVEIEGQTITFEVTAKLREKFTGKLADITFQLAGTRLLDQEGKPRADISIEDYNVAIKYLLEVQTLSVEYPGILEESRIQAGQTLMAMAIFGLSKSGGALNPENLLSLEQLKAEVISGAQDGGFREYVKMEQANPEIAGRNPLPLDDALLMRWKREYVARIEALQKGEAYAFNIAIPSGMTDPTGNDGWLGRQTPLPPAFGGESAEESIPAAHSSPRPRSERTGRPAEAETSPPREGGRFAERVSQISNENIRTAVSGWSEDKQKSFFQTLDNLKAANPDISARDAERQAYTRSLAQI